MPISSIAQVLLRLFALSWFLNGLIQITSVIILVNRETGSSFYQTSLAPYVIYLVAGVLFWNLAPMISRLITKKNDGEASLEGVTEQQLFSTAFLGLGLYFALDSFARVFSWIHFFMIRKSPEYGFHREEEPSYYEVVESGLTLALGVALIFTARIWAKKLCAKSE